MITFLPYPNFRQSAQSLDTPRLNSQRLEAWNILGILQYPTAFRSWYYHPAVTMWAGYESALKLYLREILVEWSRRGCQALIPLPLFIGELIQIPWWLGDERLHSSHRSNLLRKNITHYSQFGWDEVPDNFYFWPVARSLGQEPEIEVVRYSRVAV